MPTTAVRPETGATIKPGPMVTVAPEREVTDERFTDFAGGSGLNGPFLADQLSAGIAHERASLNLLRSLQARSNNPVLRGKYADLTDETLTAVGVWERLIGTLGGSPQYASPAGRATEALDAKIVESLLLGGSADPMTFEQAGLQSYLCGATLCAVNAGLVEQLAEEADEGPARAALRDAATQLVPAAREHVSWAEQTLGRAVVSQAKHPFLRKAAQTAERVTDKLRTAFGGSGS